ncbi:chymotrypsin-like serine proteinase [Physella acuta]|uniref:chymotrypsin-like serine proteinase n=1 Tax=Physella acuta TaxID=109671 RepID=UPI0027DD6213|nr:chymotrypsin-like serine proteinase [Physella acuta]
MVQRSDRSTATIRMMFLAVVLSLLALSTAQDEEMEKRIVNGGMAALYAYPHQGSLQLYNAPYGWYHICGCVIVAPNKILTAAHCVDGQQARNLRVKVGSYNISDTTPYEQTLEVASFVIHSGYNPNGNGIPNDIAVIYIYGTMTYNLNVQPATLAPKGSSFANTMCVITGWGRVVGGGRVAEVLKEANMTKISRSECLSKWILSGQIITDKHICVYEASKPSGSRPSACNGDSGGPMLCGPQLEYLAGITSWGVSTCSGDMPSVYTRVSEYVDWYQSQP